MVLADTPHACAGDLAVRQLAIPPDFFLKMRQPEWAALRRNRGMLSAAQVRRLYVFLGVPAHRRPAIKTIMLSRDDLDRFSAMRRQAKKKKRRHA